jgi:predicted RNA binding protein YcfA (HicA-like mRNA interferase family)
MPPLPRNVSQTQAIRALVRAGGVEVARRGKGSHRLVKMPNGQRLTVPDGIIKVGTLGDLIKEAGLTVEEFIKLL